MSSAKVQGKKVKCIYGYKATMNDELNIKVDDVIMLTQCSEDETWLEGTLNGVTGWFPSNYVQFIEELSCGSFLGNNRAENNDYHKYQKNESFNHNKIDDSQNKIHNNLRIKCICELKKSEKAFLDEMYKFVKVAVFPLQSANEIFPITFVQKLNSTVNEIIRCHQTLYHQLKEIPDNSDAKIGNMLMNIAGQFKSVYESYARSNPKFTNMMNKKREQLSKYFEPSLDNILASSSTFLPAATSTINTDAAVAVSIYMTKLLAAPFKQLEVYVKLLKEIYHYTEDYHIDRGDVQRCIEFYSSLLLTLYEMRKKKEIEIDILSSKINNLDVSTEAYFKSVINSRGEMLFISTVLVVTNVVNFGNVDIEIRDRIMIVLPSSIIFLKQNAAASTSEFDYDFKINLINTIPGQTQLRKVVNLEAVNTYYGGGLLNHSSLFSSYLFELIGFHASGNFSTRFLIAFPTQYDMRQSFEVITGILIKNRPLQQEQSKMQAPVQQSLVRQGSSGLTIKQYSDQKLQRDCASPTNFNHNSSNVANSSTTGEASVITATVTTTTTIVATNKRMFSIRPHPPLIPHFQLPNDAPQTNNLDGSLTLKRFMYKKTKLLEPFGKYHGTDDDLKMLNVIESLCKTRVRKSFNINSLNYESSATNKTTKPLNLLNNAFADGDIIPSSYINHSEKNLSKIVTRLSEDKKRLEESIQLISNELSEYKKSNNEFKSIISSMQKQLENEKQIRRKLETFVRKHLRINKNNDENNQSGDLINNILMNIEHESSI